MIRVFTIMLIFSFVFFPDILLSSKNNILKGIVITEKENKPVIAATVRIEGSALGAVTGNDGAFMIKGLLPGTYNILTTYVGYTPAKSQINIQNKETADTIKITIKLKENFLQTSEVVISANKKIQSVQDVPISISIIDKQSILDRNIILFEEALKYVPGVQMNNGSISIRGSSGFAFGLGSRISLLIDGFPMLSGDNGDIKFDVYPAAEIERIEIIKGAGSALYGTGALGGVVNIISKEPSKEPSINFRVFSGIYTQPNYEQWKYRSSLPFKNGALLSYSQSLGKFKGLISGQIVKDEGFRDYNDSFWWNLLGKFKYDLSENTKISLLTNYAKNDKTDWVYWNSLDSATRPPTNTNKDIRINSDKFVIASEIKQIVSSKLFGVFKIGLLRTTFSNTFQVSNPEYRQSTANSVNSEIQFNNVISSSLGLTYGLNYNYNNVESATYGNHNQTISAMYGQMELTNIPKLIITAGIRLDYEKTEGSNSSTVLSPKLGFNYKLIDDFRLRLSGGRGFRAPTVAEKFASVNFQGFKVIPNPELKPEKSWSTELGLTYNFFGNDFSAIFDLSAFYNYMNDLIEPTFDVSLPDAPIKFQNITKARIIGTELGVKMQIFNFIKLSSALTLMNPQDLTLDEQLKYRSDVLWYNNISLPIDFFELQFDYRYLSKVQNVDKTLGLQIKDYDERVPAHILDARLIINLFKMINAPLRIGLNINNLLNYYYTEVPGNIGPTRYLSFQLEGSF